MVLVAVGGVGAVRASRCTMQAPRAARRLPEHARGMPMVPARARGMHRAHAVARVVGGARRKPQAQLACRGGAAAPLPLSDRRDDHGLSCGQAWEARLCRRPTRLCAGLLLAGVREDRWGGLATRAQHAGRPSAATDTAETPCPHHTNQLPGRHVRAVLTGAQATGLLRPCGAALAGGATAVAPLAPLRLRGLCRRCGVPTHRAAGGCPAGGAAACGPARCRGLLCGRAGPGAGCGCGGCAHLWFLVEAG